MNERKPVELHVIKYPRDPRELDADINDLPDVACPERTLPLDHQLLETLRGLDLDSDRAEAIEEINTAFDKVKMEQLTASLGYILAQIQDKADAECFSWILNGKVETLRELAERVGMSAAGVLKRIRKLEEQLRGILQGSKQDSTLGM